jgi:hypothetical protein
MHKGKCDSPSYTFKSKAEAEKAGGALGLSGSHTHTNEKGETLYMPGKNHEEFEKAQKDGKGYLYFNKNSVYSQSINLY